MLIRKFLILFLLILPVNAFAADVLLTFGGCESGSLLDAAATTGSPSCSTTQVANGVYALELAGAVTKAGYQPHISFTAGGAGNEDIGTSNFYFTVGFRVYMTDVTPSAEALFFGLVEGSALDPNYSLAMETDGDLILRQNSEGTIIVTATTPFSINEWNYVEVTAFLDNTGGTLELFVNGSSVGSGSSLDTISGNDFNGVEVLFQGPTSGDGTYFFDDWYVLYDNANTAVPTPLANNSDGLEVFAYQCGKASQAADTGYTALDSTTDANNWDTSCDAPWSATAGATYTGTPLNGAVVFNDAATNGHGPGPSGGAYTIDGTIKGGKWSWLLDRGTGGATTHTAYYGSSADTPLSSFTLSDPNADVLRAIVLESALVPTSSETFAMGGGVAGAQDLIIDQMMGEILHLPAAVQAGPKKGAVIVI